MTRPGASHILLVEDSPTQAMGMISALETAGFEVNWVTTADQALLALAQERPDLVITDYHLPDMLGDELCRMIRSRFDTRDIPVILLTVEEAHRLEVRALQSGVDDFFEKTVTPSEILPRVHSLLRKGRGSGPGLIGQAMQRPRLLLGVVGRTRQEALAASFEELGFEIRRVENLTQALELRDQVDGLLLDASLVAEDQSGAWQALLDRDAGTQSSPLIILAPRDESNAFLLEAGADDVIVNETEPEVLRLKVKNQVLRHRVRKENLDLEGRYREQELRAAMASELEQKNLELSLSYQRLQDTQGQLVHSERMAALGQMVAGMAHEINNPLAYVTANVHNVLGWLAGLDEVVKPVLDPPQGQRWEKSQRRLKESLDGLERVKELVLQLRTYSRLDESELKTIDVEDSVRSVLRIIGHRVRQQSVELIEQYHYPAPLECQPGAFNQVVMNLMTNALDAVPEGGQVILRTEDSDLGFRLTVSDNGPGVAEALREKLFEPFFTTKPAGQGTGLGLAISRQIMERHGGTLTLEPEQAGLTTFAIVIPQPEKSHAV